MLVYRANNNFCYVPSPFSSSYVLFYSINEPLSYGCNLSSYAGHRYKYLHATCAVGRYLVTNSITNSFLIIIAGFIL
jgi:hypothetical protein